MAKDSVATNLRFLIWERKLPMKDRVDILTQWLGCSQSIAEKLLEGEAKLDPKLLDNLRDELELSEEEYFQIPNGDLLEAKNTNIYEKNLTYFIERIKEIKKTKEKYQDLAKAIGVYNTTISRWINQDILPRKKRIIKALCKYFNEDYLKINSEPFFLYPKTGKILNNKKWLIDKIERMTEDQLASHMPSLIKIFKDT